jgi:hypothetical protein
MNEKENNHNSNQYNHFLAHPSNHVEIENDYYYYYFLRFPLK